MGVKDKVGGIRRKSSTRMIVIIALIIVVAIMLYFWKQARLALVGVLIVLLAALGLETTGNDWDLGKLFQTGSFTESKIEKTEGGTWIFGEECTKDKMNCANFTYREDAQDLFNKCGGTENDINGLDGDKDGVVCEALPLRSAQ